MKAFYPHNNVSGRFATVYISILNKNNSLYIVVQHIRVGLYATFEIMQCYLCCAISLPLLEEGLTVSMWVPFRCDSGVLLNFIIQRIKI